MASCAFSNTTAGPRICRLRRSVTLSSNVTRAPAHAFYAALGYRIAATSYILRKDLAGK